MKNLIIPGLIALIILLALPGAVSAGDNVVVSGSVVDEDLTVTAISPNVGVGAVMFANEPNIISVTVTNNGGLDAAASIVSVVVGSETYTAAVGALAAGASETVTVTDTVSHDYSTGPISVTATADSTGVVAESDETNNEMSSDLTLYYNGYKGKRWTDGNDMTTQATFDGRYDVIYSAGNTAYNGAGWIEKNYSWDTSDLPIPAGSTVVSARLYQGYTYNKMGVDPTFTMSFNGNTVTPSAIYQDIKGFGSYSYPYGVYVYDVTTQFSIISNSITITPEAGQNYGIYGAYLIVTYSDPATSEKQIWINDEFDMVQSQAQYSVTSDEATVFANFAGVDNSNMASAQAVAILASAGDTDKSKFFFNSQEYTGFWTDYLSSPQIGFSVFDVTGALASGDNEAGLQSFDPGTKGDNMYAINTILIVEKTESAVAADFSATPLSGNKPLEVAFTDASTGYIVSYAWDFDNDGTTDSTDQNPSYTYNDRGTYTVSLTVTGVGSSDTKTRTDYITVTEPAPEIDFSGTPTSGTEPLTVAFTATNTGGQVDSWAWDFDNDGTVDSTLQNPSYTYDDAGTYTVSLTATGPDFTDTETKTNYIDVGTATIDVSVTPAGISFGNMVAGTDSTGSTEVAVTTTGGTSWSVTAAASNGGYMSTGSSNLANPFQLANGPGSYQAMTSDFANFMTGTPEEDRSDTANVIQAVDAADAPGAYSITLTFTGSFA
jgi:PKD repeat protein